MSSNPTIEIWSGTSYALVAEGTHQASRQEVVEGQHRRCRGVEYALRGRKAVVKGDPAGKNLDTYIRVVVQKVAHRRNSTGVRCAAGHAGEVDHRPVIVAIQQIEQFGERRSVISGNHWRAGGSRITVDEDNRFELFEEPGEVRFGHPRRAQHETVTPPARFDGENHLLRHRLGGVGDQDVIAVGCCRPTQAPQDPVKAGVLQIGDDDGDGVGLAEDQAAGHRTGGVVQLHRGRPDARRQSPVDRRIPVHHSRHGGEGDTGTRRHIRDGLRSSRWFGGHCAPIVLSLRLGRDLGCLGRGQIYSVALWWTFVKAFSSPCVRIASVFPRSSKDQP